MNAYSHGVQKPAEPLAAATRRQWTAQSAFYPVHVPNQPRWQSKREATKTSNEFPTLDSKIQLVKVRQIEETQPDDIPLNCAWTLSPRGDTIHEQLANAVSTIRTNVHQLDYRHRWVSYPLHWSRRYLYVRYVHLLVAAAGLTIGMKVHIFHNIEYRWAVLLTGLRSTTVREKGAHTGKVEGSLIRSNRWKWTRYALRPQHTAWIWAAVTLCFGLGKVMVTSRNWSFMLMLTF